MENPLHNLGQQNEDVKDCAIKVNAPSKVIHFSDGTIEEFDDDDETDQPKTVDTEVIDTKSMPWIPWMKHYAMAGGNKAVEYCDYIGEGLASFLGITTPKYQLEISEFERRQAAEKKAQEELAGWNTSNGPNGTTPLVLNQPASANQTTANIPPV